MRLVLLRLLSQLLQINYDPRPAYDARYDRKLRVNAGVRR